MAKVDTYRPCVGNVVSAVVVRHLGRWIVLVRSRRKHKAAILGRVGRSITKTAAIQGTKYWSGMYPFLLMAQFLCSICRISSGDLQRFRSFSIQCAYFQALYVTSCTLLCEALLMVHPGRLATSCFSVTCTSSSSAATLDDRREWAEIFADGIHVTR